MLFWAWCYLQGVSFLYVSGTPQISCHTNHLMPSTATIPIGTQLFIPCLQSRYNNILQSSNICLYLSISFRFHRLPPLCVAFDQDHLLQHVLQLLRLPHHYSIFIKGIVFICNIRNPVLFFFIIIEHNPSFSMLGPNKIVGHETA